MSFDFAGLFSSKSSNQSSSSTSTATDSRMVNDSGAVGINSANSSNSNITVIDGGAMHAAEAALYHMDTLSTTAIKGMGDVSTNALAANGIVSTKALSGMADLAQTITAAAGNMVSSQGASLSNAFSNMIGLTAELSKQNYTAQASNLNLAREMAQSSQSAYADASAQASGTKNIVIAGMVVVGIAAVMAFRKM